MSCLGVRSMQDQVVPSPDALKAASPRSQFSTQKCCHPTTHKEATKEEQPIREAWPILKERCITKTLSYCRKTMRSIGESRFLEEEGHKHKDSCIQEVSHRKLSIYLKSISNAFWKMKVREII